MDKTHEGFLLMGTTMILFVVFLVTILVIMLVYRKRKLEHNREIVQMNEQFAREMLQAQLEIQQRTMQEIGREIHDNVGQKLTLAALYAQNVEQPAEPARMVDKIETVAGLINESLADLRNLSRELTDPDPSTRNLVALMQKDAEKINALGVCRVHFTSNQESIDLALGVKHFIVRIIQEFIQNSLKHANCQEIGIRLTIDEKALSIVAQDDGDGFVLSDPEVYQGIGIANMRKRASLMSADLQLKSSPGAGTSLYLIIPGNKLI
jgi:signal transduction histidine kinase